MLEPISQQRSSLPRGVGKPAEPPTIHHVIHHVLKYLPTLKVLVIASGICRNWRQLAKDRTLWTKFRTEIVQKNIQKNLRYEIDLNYVPDYISGQKVSIIPTSFTPCNNIVYVKYKNNELLAWNLNTQEILKKWTMSADTKWLVCFENKFISKTSQSLLIGDTKASDLAISLDALGVNNLSRNQVGTWNNILIVVTPKGILLHDLLTGMQQTLEMGFLPGEKTTVRVMKDFLIITNNQFREKDLPEVNRVDIWSLRKREWHLRDYQCGTISLKEPKGRPTLFAQQKSPVSDIIDIETLETEKINSQDFSEYDENSNASLSCSQYYWSEVRTNYNPYKPASIKEHISRCINQLHVYSLELNQNEKFEFKDVHDRTVQKIKKIEKYGPYIMFNGMLARLWFDELTPNAIWTTTTPSWWSSLWYVPQKQIMPLMELTTLSNDTQLNGARYVSMVFKDKIATSIKVIDFAAPPFLTLDPANSRSTWRSFVRWLNGSQ